MSRGDGAIPDLLDGGQQPGTLIVHLQHPASTRYPVQLQSQAHSRTAQAWSLEVIRSADS